MKVIIMAAPVIPSTVRIQLKFIDVSSHKLPKACSECWFLIHLNSVKTIRDVVNEIRCKFQLSNSVDLFLNGVILPPWEDIRILHVNDLLDVKPSLHGNAIELNASSTSPTSGNVDSILNVENDAYSNKKKKKSKKRKHEVEEEHFLPSSASVSRESKNESAFQETILRKEVETDCQNETTMECDSISESNPPSAKIKKSYKGPRVKRNSSYIWPGLGLSRTIQHLKVSNIVQTECQAKEINDKLIAEANANLPEKSVTVEDTTECESLNSTQNSMVEQNESNTTEKKRKRHRNRRKRGKKNSEPLEKNTWETCYSNSTSSQPAAVQAEVNGRSQNGHIKFDSEDEELDCGADESGGGNSAKSTAIENQSSELSYNDAIDCLNELNKRKQHLLKHVNERTLTCNSEIPFGTSTPKNTSYAHNEEQETVSSQKPPVLNDEMVHAPNTISEEDIPVQVASKSRPKYSAGNLLASATVFSRNKSKKMASVPLSKEEQLRSISTNQSMILKYNGEGDVSLPISEEKKDYTTLPVMKRKPEVGEKIVYKVLEVTSSYTPEVSEFKVATVTDYDASTDNVTLELSRDSCKVEERSGRFDIVLEDENEIFTNLDHLQSKVSLPWCSLLDVREMKTIQ